MKTDKQRRIYNGVIDFIAENGHSPTHTEITEMTGLRESTVNYCVQILEEMGELDVIRDEEGKSVSRGTYIPGMRDILKRYAKTVRL
tara:strand:- start:232 stop:492 length:261 start_codon:yes stop_codon:yes gene_type:complete